MFLKCNHLLLFVFNPVHNITKNGFRTFVGSTTAKVVDLSRNDSGCSMFSATRLLKSIFPFDQVQQILRTVAYNLDKSLYAWTSDCNTSHCQAAFVDKDNAAFDGYRTAPINDVFGGAQLVIICSQGNTFETIYTTGSITSQ